MTKILFICHGSICRSAMCKYIMRDLVKKAGLENEIIADAAATSREEIGNPVYPPARAKLAEHGIECSGHAARQVTRDDYDKYDLILGMDSENMYNLRRLWSEDPEGKLRMLMDFTGRPGEVADPWYTRDFESTWRDALEGCEALLQYISE